jgi:carboxyl-terminal processing protease
MIERFAARALLFLLIGCLVLPLRSAEPAASEVAAGAEKSTNSFHPVTPGVVDGRIAFLTASMLEKNHYLKLPFDSALSARFFDLYLETFDPQHRVFLQSDVAEFDHYRTNLNHLTITDRRVGDTTPGCEIFNRYVERLQQRTAYVDDLLKNDKFTFDTDERIAFNRKSLPYPKDLDEAKALWREQLRFEYLQERLGKIGARKKAAALAAKKKTPAAGTTSQPKAAEESNQPKSGALDSATYDRLRQALREKMKEPGSSTGPATVRPQANPPRVEEASQPRATNGTAVAASKKTEDEEIIETLSHRYHRNLKFFTDWNNDDVLQTYLTALARVYDPHSDYLGRAQLEQFSISMNLSLFGIGAELVSEDGYCRIRRLLPGGPAVKNGKIKENDRIVAVAQSNQPPVDIVEMSLNKAVQLIRGPKGTEVRLTIIPAGADASDRKVVSIVRDEIPLEESAAKARIIDSPDGHGGTVRLGVIDLPSFYATFDTSVSKDKPEPKSTTVDVARLLKKLEEEKVAGIILDLRRNGGGSLEEAIKLTGLFIKTGPVVQVKEVDNTVQEADDTDPAVLYDGPLVVLTSRGSASASEIVAGALQDYGRALIIGDVSTHGKGTVQSVNQLRPYMNLVNKSLTNDPGALKLTIKKFYRPSGASTQKRGVVPDIVLPSLANESKDIGEAALENPLPWDEIPSAKFDRLNLVEPYVADLRKHSAERVAADKEYSYIREDIERFKKQQADKTISLNEKARLKENQETEERNKARDKERLARPAPPEKIYELTLKQADQPGLPPPVVRTNAALANLSGHPATRPAAASANSAAVASSSPVGEDNLDEPDEEKPPAQDASLAEAERILVDYLSVLPKGNLVTAGH